jgi:hypothetical protein
MLQSRGQLLAGAVLLCLALASAEPLRIDLIKRTLDAHALSAQHAALRHRFALGARNGGDDIPLLDFMDAQVTTGQRYVMHRYYGSGYVFCDIPGYMW